MRDVTRVDYDQPSGRHPPSLIPTSIWCVVSRCFSLDFLWSPSAHIMHTQPS